MGSEATTSLAQNLTEAGYAGLFLAGDRRLVDAVWDGGSNRAALEEIVRSNDYGDVPRVLASEILYVKQADQAPGVAREVLAQVYSRALALTGIGDRPMVLSGNEWGFMYHADENGGDAYGGLGARLLESGSAAVPFLMKLLDDPTPIYYVGSQDATLGNALAYRVKDAAAFYIGKATRIPVQFHQDDTDRDAEIERLRAAVHRRP